MDEMKNHYREFLSIFGIFECFFASQRYIYRCEKLESLEESRYESRGVKKLLGIVGCSRLRPISIASLGVRFRGRLFGGCKRVPR